MFAKCAGCGEYVSGEEGDLCRDCASQVQNVETPYWKIAGMDPPGVNDEPSGVPAFVFIETLWFWESLDGSEMYKVMDFDRSGVTLGKIEVGGTMHPVRMMIEWTELLVNYRQVDRGRYNSIKRIYREGDL